MVLLAENWEELVQKIKAKGMRPGVALKPGTPIEEVYPLVCLPLILMFLDFVAGFYIVWNI
jgi:pentose-5-phosphate-3-epimerase